jgi:hypothetical protein
MILKKAGLPQVNSLGTIILFQPDCNYAFKFHGKEMMQHAEEAGSLAIEQYGSQARHRYIDFAMKKTLSNDLL